MRCAQLRRAVIAYLYRERILPGLIDFAMRQDRLTPYRRRLLAHASGLVVEIGVGSGRNLPFYGSRVATVIGLDPSDGLLALAREQARRWSRPVRLLRASADAIPLADESADTVVCTWTLCSIPKVDAALCEMRRILRRDGTLLFVEHGRAPEPDVARWQRRLTPVWKHIAGGCHLDRSAPESLVRAGFTVEGLEQGYMPGPRVLTYMSAGRGQRA